MFFKTGQSGAEFLIAGLGNPGKQYEHTRHNAGFDALDYCAREWGVSVTRAKFDALTGTGTVGGHKVVLLKPQTFMNLSGEAVRKAAAFYRIDAPHIIVLFDDISHNGIKSIIAAVGQDFPRVKIGVGQKPHPQYDLADWVLSRPAPDDRAAIEARFADAARAVELIMDGKFTLAQSRYNG